MPERIAIIDMGTNTFHLLIAEKSMPPKILLREREAVKIGKGGINKNTIPEEGFERAIHCLKRFKILIDQYGAPSTLAFGTSAVRNATNGVELTQRITSTTGITVSIIDGNEEAGLIYLGAKAALGFDHEPSLIVDIGGGSVEFIIGNKDGVLWKRSFEIGGQRLLEKFQKHDPILSEEVWALEKYLDEQLAELRPVLKQYNPKVLAGVSGTFDTLSEIYCAQNGLDYLPDDPETPFEINSFVSIYEEIKSNDRAGRMAIKGMIEMRVDMIVVACVLVDFILHMHQFTSMRVSTYSLKEGVLAREC